MVDQHNNLINIVQNNYKKDTSKEKLIKDWNELCKLYKDKYKQKISIIEKYTRPGFDNKQCIFIQTLKTGEGFLFVENGYVIETLNRTVIACLNMNQMWNAIQSFYNGVIK